MTIFKTHRSLGKWLLVITAACLLAPPPAVAATVGIILPRDCTLGLDTKEKFSQHLAASGFDARDTTVFMQRPSSDKVSRLNSIRKFLAFGTDVIVVWGGTAVKEILNEAGKAPIVFVGAHDPVGDGLVASLETPGGSVTGVLGRTSTAYLLDNIAECVGGGELGVIYHSDITDSNSQLEELMKIAPGKGFSLVPFDARSRDIQEAAGPFAPVQFIFLAQGCEAEGAAMEDLTSLGKPVATQNPGLTGGGIVFSLAPDVDETIKVAAELTARILKGEDPGTIPVSRVKKISFIINMTEAGRTGLKVPFSVLNKATQVIR